MRNISQKTIANIPIPLPSLEKQREVVAKLDKTTEQLRQVQTALAASRADVDVLPSKLLAAVFAEKECRI